MTVAEELEALERRLLDPEFRKSAEAVGSLLADEFIEYASNGEIFDKARIIEVLCAALPTPMDLTDFKAVVLAPDAALATFRYERGATAARPAAVSLRSSVWKRLNGRWQMVFHQGTLLPPELK